MTDLEQLLRDTMTERATTLTDAPRWDGPPARTRGPWLAIGAAAASVLVVAGGASLVGRSDPEPSGGGVAQACETTLPADWAAALSRTDPLYHGRPVEVGAQLPSGAVVGTVTHKGAPTDIVLAKRNGDPELLATVPADRLVTRVDADDRWVVVSSTPAVPTDNPDWPVDHIALLDLQGSGRLLDIAMSAVVQGRGAVLMDGAVYWVDGTTRNAAEGRVERYDTATHTYDTIGTATGSDGVIRDVRGVGWPGGSVPDRDAPDFVPPFFTGNRFNAVYADGTDVAWQDSGSDVIDWAGPDGTVTSWTIDVGTHPEFVPVIAAVSGPVVFFWINDTGNGAYALDTRSGAVAHLGDSLDANFPSFQSVDGVLLVHVADLTTTRLDPSELSALKC